MKWTLPLGHWKPLVGMKIMGQLTTTPRTTPRTSFRTKWEFSEAEKCMGITIQNPILSKMSLESVKWQCSGIFNGHKITCQGLQKLGFCLRYLEYLESIQNVHDDYPNWYMPTICKQLVSVPNNICECLGNALQELFSSLSVTSIPFTWIQWQHMLKWHGPCHCKW